MTQEDKILKGFDLLDKDRLGWEKEIDLDSLDMGTGCLCVLGQVYGGYRRGIDSLRLPHFNDKNGFMILKPQTVKRWENLTNKVKKLIKERLNK